MKIKITKKEYATVVNMLAELSSEMGESIKSVVEFLNENDWEEIPEFYKQNDIFTIVKTSNELTFTIEEDAVVSVVDEFYLPMYKKLLVSAKAIWSICKGFVGDYEAISKKFVEKFSSKKDA